MFQFVFHLSQIMAMAAHLISLRRLRVTKQNARRRFNQYHTRIAQHCWRHLHYSLVRETWVIRIQSLSQKRRDHHAKSFAFQFGGQQLTRENASTGNCKLKEADNSTHNSQQQPVARKPPTTIRKPLKKSRRGKAFFRPARQRNFFLSALITAIFQSDYNWSVFSKP